ncbi:fused MFS/spermidine synthase [Solidesulfovibrio sp.]|uniref:fused MFS/spermidine synthase n=1 Tax=Solidesulfovibrio sp. TaxID=2910990 RepID=UPI00262ADA90|nr:fused MFS/spermidine synthase [Solidesulfovibrio sp.]
MLGIVVFGCGAAVMVLELVGARILAPFFGTSMVVWSGLIGLVLASLAVGYWQGGRIADRRPSPGVLSGVIALAAALVAATAATKIPLLEFLATRAPGPRLAVLAAVLLLFAPAAALLGMVAPFAVRLSVRDAATSGTTAGRLYALSTLGSIVGTFAAGFFLIAACGTTATLLAVAGFLLLLSLLASRTGIKGKAAAAAVLLLSGLAIQATDQSLAAAGVADVDTAYGRVLVYSGMEPDTGRTLRIMTTGPLRCQSAIYPDAPSELALPYTRFFAMGYSLVPEPRRVLVLGGGGYAFARHAARNLPGATVTVVELDPGVTALARKHFGLADDPRLTIVHEDARTFVNRPGEPYDLIYLDVFGTDYLPPFHMVTREAATRLAALLAPGGAVVVNAIGAPQGTGGRFLRSLAATFATAFPDLAVYPLAGPEKAGEEQNVMLVARPEEGPGPVPTDAETRAFLTGRLDDPFGNDALVLTDDHAPVEWLGLGL